MKEKLKALYWDLLDFLEDVSSFISKNWLNYSIYLYAILATVFLLWLM
tara:strand:- start:691 stop:834 length:144 start_codon:yes stop_codon:yes gene_type:complete